MDTSESFVKQKNHWSYLDLPPPFFCEQCGTSSNYLLLWRKDAGLEPRRQAQGRTQNVMCFLLINMETQTEMVVYSKFFHTEN